MKFVALALLMLLGAEAYAHKPSDSYLQLMPTAEGFTGEWRIALRDLEPAVGLDRDGDRKITWGEVRTRHNEIANYALGRLAIAAGGSPCNIRAGAQLVDDLSDGAYTVLPLVVSCERNVAPWSLDYSLLFDIDATHRGLVSFRGPDTQQTFALSPQNNRAVLSADAASPVQQFVTMAREGVWHIWIGFDHILFLLALLLPAGLRATREPDTRAGWAPLWKDVLTLVTAFTVAHSITLSLAAMKIVSLPPRLIETTIALSIVVAGLRMRYAISQPAAWIAFGFGLIHGFGFANVLADLQLPTGSLALSLFAFNVGVELGQCAIVLLALPLIRYAQRHAFYRRTFMPAAAVLIAAVGVAWSVERGAGISLSL
ncbi:membrane protein [Steroidobacter agaridevorans]|uniref:Membrane protein n=1 Tax=Steroidobacter agaridevorans TaxID=2695856 RepID=A0A829Y9M0_9GAMM|nr:HupE/UreJ family protein [Steroidobacter agaridevorans]GFE80027.1 membrane protein [Steroidobacter agaridevorans]